MKKTVSLLLVLVFMLCMLTGCHVKFSKKDAQAIAADAFGFNTSEVTFLYTKLNSMYASTYYTVVFEIEGTEYSVGINAETGEVFSKNVGLPENQ